MTHDNQRTQTPMPSQKLASALNDFLHQSRDNAQTPHATQPAEVTDSMIREAFLTNGFTIKEGHSDLKPYVYAAARALLALQTSAQATRVEVTDAEIDALCLSLTGSMTRKERDRAVARAILALADFGANRNHPAQGVPDTLKDHQIAAMVNTLRDIARQFHGHDSLRERIANVLVPALKAEAKTDEPVAWRVLCRRLYVELFYCDQQMQSVTKYGKPVFTQGSTVRDVLRDAKSALESAAHPAPGVPEDVARDTERLNELEALVQSKGTHGLSFDYCKHVEDGYVVEKGFRVMWRHHLGERKPTLREAIDAASPAQKGQP